MYNWLSTITVDEIPSKCLRDIAHANGIDDAISLMQHLPGMDIYIPVVPARYMVRQMVANQCIDSKPLSLATTSGLSVKEVNNIIKHKERWCAVELFSSESMRLIHSRCGDGVARRLLMRFTNSSFYIPTDGFKIARRRYIAEHYTVSNGSELALDLGVSERHIRDVVSDMYASRHVEQLSLFGT